MTPLDGAAGWPQWRLVRGEPSAEHDLDLLGPAERRRAMALRRPAERHTYVAAHAALRRLLGAQLDRDPAELTFVREPCPHCGAPNGRPARRCISRSPAPTASRCSRSPTGRWAWTSNRPRPRRSSRT
ncbi:hypothetical protein [Streptomyces sp. NPDC002851]